MRKVKKYKIQKETYTDMCDAGRFNRSLEITFRDKTGIHTHKLNAGYGDDLDVYMDTWDNLCPLKELWSRLCRSAMVHRQ